MTQPHRYIENQFVKLSRGTLNGEPLLMPGKAGELSNEIRAIFLRHSKRLNISILALNVEPFGYEAIIFDPDMRRSELLKSVNQCISMKVKKSTDHCESVWSNKKPGNTPILDSETLANEIFKVCIRPVEKGYVRKISNWILPHFGPSDWPELSDEIDATTKENPDPTGADLEDFKLEETSLNGGPGLFKAGGELKKVATLRTVLIDRIASFQDAEKRRRRKVLGKKACRNKDSFLADRAKNRQEYSSPNLPVFCGCADLLSKVIRCLKEYYSAYRKALASFVESKDATFPCGTLKMRTAFLVSFFPVKDDDVFHFLK